jgi:uncharacterized protein YgbK (DUF1537 family)
MRPLSTENLHRTEAKLVTTIIDNVCRELALLNSILSPPALPADATHAAAVPELVREKTPEKIRLPSKGILRASRSNADVRASAVACRVFIEDENKPQSLKALYAAIAAKGFTIGTPNPAGTLAARLAKYGQELGMVYLKGVGWWLRGKNYK